MALNITIAGSKTTSSNIVYLVDQNTNWTKVSLDPIRKKIAQAEINGNNEISLQNGSEGRILVCKIESRKEIHQSCELARKVAYKINKILNRERETEVLIQSNLTSNECAYAFVEGLALSNYQFLKYKSDRKSNFKTLSKVWVEQGMITPKALAHLKIAVEANFLSRDLVNEPLSFLTATQLSTEIKKAGKKAGFKTTVFNKAKITALKMGGLLAVNLGSPDPPTFNILEWKPKNAKNKKPIILVGKGVVYDTGGLSLKPTANSMDMMKSDMGGAAAVVGAMFATAMAKLPVHVIALIPSTDNRPGKNAYVPGDVIKMFDGTFVEVLNTDAEGRMILADALAYAKKYKPALVIDLATLTGSAAAAVGPHGIVYMGNADQKTKVALTESSFDVCERLIEFPMWEEYGEMLNSDIADMKNIGGKSAGAITAGKFLEHFTDYPWLHIDIAGSAFLPNGNSYKGKGGTGVGTRLLFDFLSKQ